VVSARDCPTCADAAYEAEVLAVLDDAATVLVEGRRERVGIELVAPVEPGERLLCHAGIALQRLTAPARGSGR
jgi:hydrogenase maturation factor